MSAEAAFYNNFDIFRKYFFRQKKMIRILSIAFILYEKYMSATKGEGDRPAEGILFFSSFIKIQERHRDMKEHSNNKVIINFSKPKFTITSFYMFNILF